MRSRRSVRSKRNGTKFEEPPKGIVKKGQKRRKKNLLRAHPECGCGQEAR